MRLSFALVVLAVVLAGCFPPPRPVAPAQPLPADAYAAYLRGRTALYEGDAAGALAYLDEAATLAPGEAGIAIARAEAMYRLDRRVAAGEAIDRATRRWPRTPEVWLAAGRIHRGAGEATKAIAAFERAIALDATLADAYLGLASTQTLAKQPARAEATLRRLVRAIPESAEGHHRIAELRLARGDDAGAEPHLRRVLVLAPDQLDDRLALAGVAYRGGRLNEALQLAREATARSDDDLDIARDLVVYLLEAGQRATAVAILDGYDRVVPLPQHVGAAWLLLRLGELDRARAAAVAAAERGGDVWLLLARVCLADGSPAAARAFAEHVDAGADDWPAAQAVIVEARVAAGDLAGARQQVDAALARFPADVGLIAAAADMALRGGDAAAGRARFTAAARVRPHDRELAVEWAAYEARSGRPRDALVLAERLLAAQPDDAAAQNLVGYLLVETRGDLRRARRLLTRARAHAPGDASVLDSWGWLLRAEGDLAGAARALDRAVAIAPLEAEIVVHAATVAVERGDRLEAAGLLAMVPPGAGPELTRVAAALRARLGAGRPPATAPPSCYARVRMRTPLLIRVVAGSALALAACSKTPSKGQCEELLTHLIDLEAAAGGAGGKLDAVMKKEIDKQKTAIRDYAVDQKFLDTCMHKTPKSVVECGIEAEDWEAVAECDTK